MKPEPWQRYQFFELRRLLDVVNRVPSGLGVDPLPQGRPEHALLRALQVLAEEERQRLEAEACAINEARQITYERMVKEYQDASRRGDTKAIRRMIAEEERWERRIAAEEREDAKWAKEAGETIEVDVWAAEGEEEDDEA
jgi:hypothetical protein